MVLTANNWTMTLKLALSRRQRVKPYIGDVSIKNFIYLMLTWIKEVNWSLYSACKEWYCVYICPRKEQMACHTDWQFILLALNIEEGTGNQEEHPACMTLCFHI